MKDHNYRLIVAYFEKTISDEGLTELHVWLEQDIAHQEQFRETMQILEASSLYFRNTGNGSSSWEKIKVHISTPDEEPIKPTIQLNWLSYAAAILLVAVSIFWWYAAERTVEPAPQISYEEINNPDGRQLKIILPDSSLVYLAGGSTIKYSKKFLGKTRSVYLNGEAFFDVNHGRKPFVITSGEVATVVLGTSFNVKAYETERKVTVTVKTGKVGVLNKINGRYQLLKHLVVNQQLEVNTITGHYVFGRANAGDVSAWTENHFVFENSPLYEVIASLQHRYGISIQLIAQERANERITAKFRNMSLKYVMQELMLLSGLSYKEKDGQIMIYESNK